MPTQRVPNLYYFEISIFWQTDSKLFLEAPLAPINTNFKGVARAEKKPIFWSIFAKKCLKRLFDRFSKICLPRSNFGQNQVFRVICESLENQFGRFKNKVDKNFQSFLKISPLYKS